MKKLLLTMTLFAALAATLVAQKHEGEQLPLATDVYLWPDGNYPNLNGREDHDIVLKGKDGKYVGKPFMRIFPADPARATGRAVVALPGGGYAHLAWDHEGYDWAPFFNDLGITLVVLNYRMPLGNHEVPVSDVHQALRYVREHAAELHVNPRDVGIMGSSAGGHLATTVATHAPADLRPDFQILFYPVVTMDTKWTHPGSRSNMIGKEPTPAQVVEFSNELQVDSLTPPAIMLLSHDDRAVPSPNSVNYYLALQRMGIPATLHIYPMGGHGWGNRETFRFHDAMHKDLTDWLLWLKPKK